MDGENYVQWKSDPADDGLNLEELERYLKQHKESRYELWGANRKRNPGRGERERQMHLNYGWWLRALRRLRDENERMRKCREVSDRAYRNLMEEAKSACTCRQKLEGVPTARGAYWFEDRDGVAWLTWIEYCIPKGMYLSWQYADALGGWQDVTTMKGTWYGPICQPGGE